MTRLRSDPLLGPLVLALLAVVLSVQLVVVVEVFLVRDVLGAGAAGYGAVGAVLALAMVAGSVSGGRVQGPGRRVRVALAGLGLIAVAVLAGGLAPSLAVFAAAMAVLGAGNGVLNVALSALVLERVPDGEMGRVLAVLHGGVQSCTVLGMAAGGLAGALASPRAVFVGAGIVGLGVWLGAVRALGPALAVAGGGGSQPRPVRPERGLRRAMATVRAVAKAHQAG